jgi:hypothetical protein
MRPSPPRGPDSGRTRIPPSGHPHRNGEPSVPIAILIRTAAPDSFWLAIAAAPADYEAITWSSFLIRNLLAVTLGNIVGGVALVGIVYGLERETSSVVDAVHGDASR